MSEKYYCLRFLLTKYTHKTKDRVTRIPQHTHKTKDRVTRTPQHTHKTKDRVTRIPQHTLNTTGATSGAGTSYPSGTPEFTPGF
jgi:hypothetical protein